MERGRIVGGRFEILQRVGAGGMGSVYRAIDTESRTFVAIKELHATAPEDQERFTRECNLLASLSEPGIVRYVDHGVTETGSRFLAMEWVEGVTLSTRLKRTGFKVRESVALVAKVASIVAAIHRRGIVHRDIKPSNIVLEHSDPASPKLLDFGVARMSGLIGGDITATGLVVGSAGYLSPEQAMGKKDVDARADVYALGCLLFKCISGRVPFRGDDPISVLLKISLEDAPRLRDVAPNAPAEIDELIVRLLAKDRDARPADAGEVAALLEGLAEVEDETSRPSLMDGAITNTEHRLSSIVLARGPTGGLGPETSITHQGPSQVGLDRALAPLGLRSEIYADGTVVVTVGSSGEPLPDLARKAVRAAIALRTADRSLYVAVTTGRVQEGRHVFIGETVDRASALLAQLMLHGNPADVAIDDTTASLVESSFDLETWRDVARIVSERTDSRVRAVFGRTAHCVGRDAELASLHGILNTTLADGEARSALVVAQSGLGKTRLLHELLSGVDRGRFEVWATRGDQLTKASPYAMLAPVVFDLAGITRGESDEERWEKLVRLATRRLRGRDGAALAEFLAAALGVDVIGGPSPDLESARRDPYLMGDRMRRALTELIDATVQRHPLVLVIDDLQWADHATTTMLEAALRTLAKRPIVVVGFARPEVDAAFPNLFSKRNLTRVPLAPLVPEAAAAVARELLGSSASAANVSAIVAQAHGNPFFVEELARGVLSGAHDILPSSMLAVLDARLDQLSSEARLVLRAAAVFGLHFWAGGIAKLVPRIDLTNELAELMRRGLVQKSGQSRFRGQAEYSFVHGPMVEAAYARLTEDDRRRGHVAAARWLEDAGERDPILLAEHYERGGDFESARGLLAISAHLALEASDLQQAARMAERALDCGAQGAERGRIHTTAAEALLWLGRAREALEHGRAALPLLPVGEAEWCAAAAAVATSAGRTGDRPAMDSILDAVSQLDLAGDAAPHRIVFYSHTAIQLVLVSYLDHAEDLFRRIAQPVAQSDPATAAWYYRAQAWRAISLGDAAQYGALMKRAAAAFDQIGDQRNACVQRVNVAYAEMTVGRFEDADAGFASVLDTAESLGLGSVIAVAKHNAGLLKAWRGLHSEAEVLLRAAIAAFSEQGDERMLAASYGYLARTLASAGQKGAALVAAREGLARTLPQSSVRAVLLATVADCLLQVQPQRLDEALEKSREAWDLLESFAGVDEGEGYVRWVRISALHASDNPTDAHPIAVYAAEKLEARAAKIPGVSIRESFLRRIPEHALTLSYVGR